ncbi:ribonuclease III [Pacificimonas flava]|uniref:Ribonuclease 3 n=2 Tax=Pacificimonas TaxID=1960290 RepID=A0A219B8X6_9SPHN|nr:MULTISPECIES: ribonuclease III [Pacificimonas]MBZ6378489.1 ribonuclease III [Pacificimonas aurantium]OWV34218.1 ribonuclease III [Pacificimonas flava]
MSATRPETDCEELRWARERLGHDFQRPALLIAALTHPSAKTKDGESYERLEFLGDRVLGLSIAEHLIRSREESEGSMNRRFSALVDKKSCAEVASELGAPAHIRMENSARAARVHHSQNVLGDICEALIGAIFLDADFETARNFVLAAWKDRLGSARQDAPPINPKNALQEWAQRRGLPIPSYRVAERSGPEHAPRFRIAVTVRGYGEACGEGTSKQDAEKAAATAFLTRENLSVRDK